MAALLLFELPVQVVNLNLLPSLPDFGTKAAGGLLAVADHGGAHEHGIVEDLVFLGNFVFHVLHQGDFGRLALPVDEVVDAAHGTEDAVKFLAGHAVLLEVDGLELDSALLEPALGLLGVEALGLTKNLNIQ